MEGFVYDGSPCTVLIDTLQQRDGVR